MQPTLTLLCHKLVQNIKIRISELDVCTLGRYYDRVSVCSCLPSWIWAFGVSRHSQSHELQKLKWLSRSKKRVFHWMDKIIYQAVFMREKRMFCSIKASGVWCTAHAHFVGFLRQVNTNTCQMDGCLSCILLPWVSASSSVLALFLNWL